VFCEYKGIGGRLAITSSLYTILGTIEVNKLTDGLPLWVDQICINQTDAEEKSHQVKLMGQIYAMAEKTLIDLGDDSLHDQKGLALLKCLIKEKKTWKPLEMGEALISPQYLRRLRSMFESTFRFFNNSSWIALGDLRHKPWFTRLWVLQEYVLSRNPIVIYCSKSVA
jgi:Heterokaryon incompatibility protein (HET)